MKTDTGYQDVNGNTIYDGSILEDDCFDRNERIQYKVRWSDYHGSWIGDNPNEIYDISPSRFSKAILIQE